MLRLSTLATLASADQSTTRFPNAPSVIMNRRTSRPSAKLERVSRTRTLIWSAIPIIGAARTDEIGDGKDFHQPCQPC